MSVINQLIFSVLVELFRYDKVLALLRHFLRKRLFYSQFRIACKCQGGHLQEA